MREAVDGALGLGFGFVEVGGVTSRCPSPAIRARASSGCSRTKPSSIATASTARAWKPWPAARTGAPAAGWSALNPGANSDPADRAADYAILALRLAPLADFLTINVSSPNTPGLRDLQAESALDDLVARSPALSAEVIGGPG